MAIHCSCNFHSTKLLVHVQQNVEFAMISSRRQVHISGNLTISVSAVMISLFKYCF